ncbi:MAG TPA: phenylalanine--tRNA ligase subunit alpha [candidate division Zixibacteria bacterium]|nr:phenylalanine--tRNA ligase subunit alpha [candidate division Zixibacteria bacterium]
MTELASRLEALRQRALGAVDAAADVGAVEALRLQLLGRSGELTTLMRELGSVPAAERPAVGRVANEVRTEVERAIRDRLEALKEADLRERLEAERIDMSAPGRPLRLGHLHPTMTAMVDFREIFHAFGFELFEGPEIETDWWNFEALNIPPDHPARDLWDTMYVAEPGSDPPRPAEDGTILRTHTSPVQIRAMRALKPPIRVYMPGRCYRYENVAADRNFEFFQIELLVVDHDTSMADLKGTLEEFARAIYGPIPTRFRPGYYPFTEPSVAFDLQCQVCHGAGCPACKHSGWVTILGAGMVHPVVIRNGGYDPDEYQGYAVGFGLDRLVMNRHGIADIRHLMGGDLRFLEQFSGGR